MSTEDRLDALERRVRELEDTIAIYQVLASYGPSVDGGAGDAVHQLWTEDCRYDTDTGSGGMSSRDEVATMANNVGGVPPRFAHVINTPIVVVDGDTAVATGHSTTYRRDGERFYPDRVSANRWELERVDGRWRTKLRVNRLLDGSPEARAVLARGLRESLEG
jgi:hypothetical protein